MSDESASRRSLVARGDQWKERSDQMSRVEAGLEEACLAAQGYGSKVCRTLACP